MDPATQYLAYVLVLRYSSGMAIKWGRKPNDPPTEPIPVHNPKKDPPKMQKCPCTLIGGPNKNNASKCCGGTGVATTWKP